MFAILAQVRWLAVAAATAASFVLGGLWFTVAFGRAYAAALGRSGAPPAPPAPIFVAGPLLWSLATSVTSAVLLRALGIDRLVGGLLFGGLVGAGFLAATTANTGVNPNIPRPGLYAAVSGEYHLAAGLLISGILVALR